MRVQIAKSHDVKLNEELSLILEPENMQDEYAIKITNRAGTLLGYLPRYYAQGVSQLIGNETVITCRVIEVTKEQDVLNVLR